MARIRFTLDRAGVREILNSGPVRTTVIAKADQVASGARSASGMRVFVDPGTTDRAVATVVVADKKASAVQAKTGFLSKAATAAGLEFTEGAMLYTTKAGNVRRATAAQIKHWTRNQ